MTSPVEFAPGHWNNPDRGSQIEQRWAQFWTFYSQDLWEPETKELVQATLKPGDLFVDIGAWIGPVTLWALEAGASVIAIEPDPIALEELRRRVPADVEIWDCALGLESGTARLEAASDYGDSMSKIAHTGIPVAIRTMQEILGDRRPAMATMDIEGYEMTLLPGLAPYLASLGTTLMVALHTGVPPAEWFDGYREVSIPKTARRGGNHRGRSLAVVARP